GARHPGVPDGDAGRGVQRGLDRGGCCRWPGGGQRRCGRCRRGRGRWRPTRCTRGQPVLEVIEPHSGLLLALERAPARDETAWGCTWLELTQRGVGIDGVVADGADGLRAGARGGAAGAPVGPLAYATRQWARV